MRDCTFKGTREEFFAWIEKKERESVMRSWFDGNAKVWAEREKELDEILKENE